jgi:inorganic triphosphatase YgiF
MRKFTIIFKYKNFVLDYPVPLERELKFSLVDDFPETKDLAECFKQAGYELIVKPTIKQFDSYYDDAEQRLRKADVALRRRRVDGRSLATFKGNAIKDGALHQREEIEEAMLGNAWPETILTRIQSIVSPEILKETLELSTIRQRYLVRQKETDLAILSFDKVSANYPKSKQQVDFEEIEIEAIDGDDDDLHTIADTLMQLISLNPNSTNKLERAEVLLQLSQSFAK